MGQLIAAYRHHPHHGVPISQETVGHWVNMSQGQISKIETRRPELHIARLAFWARLLGIPAHLLWFDLPITNGRDAASRTAPTATDRHTPIFPDGLASPPASTYGEDAAHDQEPSVRHRTENHARLGTPQTSARCALAPSQLPASNGGPVEEGDDLRRRALLATLITVVASPFSHVAATANPPANARVLAARVRRVRSAYQHSSYGQALQELPSILSDLANPALDKPVDRLAAEAYQVASGLLLKSDQPTLAAVAAERSIVAAQAHGSPIIIASSMRAVVHGLMAAGHFIQAANLASTAATQMMRDVGTPSDDEAAVYGALLLRGAVAAAHAEDRARAGVLLDEASATAERVGGGDGNANWTAFGPANVLAHRVAVAVELGDAGAAVDVASTINLRELAAPERRAVVLLDTARALTQWGKYERALDAIQAAERHAPEEVRSRRPAHSLINTLAQRAPAPVQRRARDYSCSIGIDS
ncbi:hypothetical protein [Dactylosporangium sp. CA-233914]|uniref:hypothetical protein n=1 Tax=Dactylosporangium sp. CA-233914 TaxID=3239934 RepID=UPI003D8C232A